MKSDNVRRGLGGKGGLETFTVVGRRLNLIIDFYIWMFALVGRDNRLHYFGWFPEALISEGGGLGCWGG